jgi:hypothetical protein
VAALISSQPHDQGSNFAVGIAVTITYGFKGHKHDPPACKAHVLTNASAKEGFGSTNWALGRYAMADKSTLYRKILLDFMSSRITAYLI